MTWARDRLLRARLREEFIVTLHDGTSWQGLLYAVDERTVVLHRAQAIVEGGTKPVDGELLLGRTEIAYMQRP